MAVNNNNNKPYFRVLNPPEVTDNPHYCQLGTLIPV